MPARTVTVLAVATLALTTFATGCSSTRTAPSAASASVAACRAPEPATLPNTAGSLTEADSGAFCLAVDQVLDVFLTAPANAAAGMRWSQISVADTAVVGYGNSGILTPPVNVTPGVFGALRHGATTLSSTLPDGTAWRVTIVVKESSANPAPHIPIRLSPREILAPCSSPTLRRRTRGWLEFACRCGVSRIEDRNRPQPLLVSSLPRWVRQPAASCRTNRTKARRKTMFLVTGATGNVGRHVLTQLNTQGHKVRALSRRPDKTAWPVEVEVVAGDLTDRTALTAALSGVEAAFLFAAPGCGPEFAAAAEAAGVERVVLMSSGSIGDPAAVQESSIAAYHGEVEQALRDSRLEWTFLRPGAFATNTLAWAGQTKSSDVIRGAYAEATTAPIHEADIADAAVAALTQDGHSGQAYRLTGPASLTNGELARILGQTLGRPIAYQELPPEQVRAAMIGHAPAPIVDSLLAIWAASVGHPAEVTTDVEKVTGHPARSFSQWVADHEQDF